MTAAAPTAPEPAPEAPPARVTARALRASRRAEFDDLVVRIYPRLVAEVAMLIDDRRGAERLVRRALAALWRVWDQAREHSDPAELVRTQLLEHATAGPRPGRRWWRRRVAANGRAGADTLAALRGVPQVQRRVLVLHHAAGRTLEQIAAAEGTSARAVRMRLAHGAHALAHHHPATPTIPIAIGWADPDRPGPEEEDG